MNFLQQYKGALSQVLESACQNKEEINPVLTCRLMFTVRAYFVACCYVSAHCLTVYKRAMNLYESMAWLRENISEKSPFLVVYNQTSKQINEIVNSYVSDIDTESFTYNLGFIYETLLHTDVSETSVVDGDLSRNKQGSYYSPSELASYLTKAVIDNYVKNNGLQGLNTAHIIDFSCGSGIFLTEALSYIGSLLNLNHGELSHIVDNLYACDVDFIALEICKFNIIDYVENTDIYDKLSEHFRHANFLLDTENEEGTNEKIDAYLNGYIYHRDLAVGFDFLKQYDIILGNPPWEKIRFEEKSFYAQYVASIGNINFKTDVNNAIENAENSNKALEKYCSTYKQHITSAKETIKKSRRFKSSSAGELNTSNLFTEAAYNLMSSKASVGLIVKSSTIATKASKSLYDIISNRILAIYDFINRKRFFNIDGRERFSLLIMDGLKHNSFNLAMNIQEINDVALNRVKVTKKDLCLLNPETGMIPNLASSRDLAILVSIYEKLKTVADVFPTLKYGRLVHFTNHANDIDKTKLADNLPIYEGKFFSSFDGSYAGFNHIAFVDRYKAKAHAGKLSDLDKKNHNYPESRFFIKKSKWNALSANYKADYMLAWHSLTSATNSRACIATILPFMPASQSVQFLISDSKDTLVYLCCLFNSVVFDYIVKNKLTGIDLTQTFIKQIAVPGIETAKAYKVKCGGINISAFEFLTHICRELLKDDNRCDDLFSQDNEIRIELPSNRNKLQMMMDTLVACLYGINAERFDYIFKSYSTYSTDEINEMKDELNLLLS